MFRKKYPQRVVEELSKLKNPQKKSELLRSFLLEESKSNFIPENTYDQNCYSDYQARRSKSNFKVRKKINERVNVLLGIDRRKAVQPKTKFSQGKAKSIDSREATVGERKDEMLTDDWDWWKNELLEKHLKEKLTENHQKWEDVRENSIKHPVKGRLSNRTPEDNKSYQERLMPCQYPRNQSKMMSEAQENVYTSKNNFQKKLFQRSQSSCRRVEVTLKRNIQNQTIRDIQNRPGPTQNIAKVNNYENMHVETRGKIDDERNKKIQHPGQGNVVDEEINLVKNRRGPSPNPNHNKERSKPNNTRIEPEAHSAYYVKKSKKGFEKNPNQNTGGLEPNPSNSRRGPVLPVQERRGYYDPSIAHGFTDRDNSKKHDRSKQMRNVISVNHLVKLDQSVLSHIDKNRELEEYAKHLKSKWGHSIPFTKNCYENESGDSQNTSRDSNAAENFYICDIDMKGRKNESCRTSKPRIKKFVDRTGTTVNSRNTVQTEFDKDQRTLSKTSKKIPGAEVHNSYARNRQQYHIEAEHHVTNEQGYRSLEQARTLNLKQEPQILNRCEPKQKFPVNMLHLRTSIPEPQKCFEYQREHANSFSTRESCNSNVCAKSNESRGTEKNSSMKSQSSGTYERTETSNGSSNREGSICSQIYTKSVAQKYLPSGQQTPNLVQSRESDLRQKPHYTEGTEKNSHTRLQYPETSSKSPDTRQEVPSSVNYRKQENSRENKGQFDPVKKSSSYIVALQASSLANLDSEHRQQLSADSSQGDEYRKLSPHIEQLIENVKSIGQQYYKMSSKTMIPVLRQVQNTFICRFYNLRQYLHQSVQTYVENFEKNAQNYVETYEARRSREPSSRGTIPCRRQENWDEGEQSYPPRLPCGCYVNAIPRTSCCCNMCCCNTCTCNPCMYYYNRNYT